MENIYDISITCQFSDYSHEIFNQSLQWLVDWDSFYFTETRDRLTLGMSEN